MSSNASSSFLARAKGRFDKNAMRFVPHGIVIQLLNWYRLSLELVPAPAATAVVALLISVLIGLTVRLFVVILVAIQ